MILLNIVNRFGILYHIDKTAVLQEARVFNDTPINPRKCRVLLTKIIYLLYLGEPFNTKEATDLFFNVIKLFQSKDVSTTRKEKEQGLMYVCIYIDLASTNDVSRHQRTFGRCRGCHYGHAISHQGYSIQARNYIPCKCHSCIMSYH